MQKRTEGSAKRGEEMAAGEKKRKKELSARDKEIVEGYYFSCKSLKELGEQYGVTPQAIHKKIHSDKAVEYLREKQEQQVRHARGFLTYVTVKAARTMAEALDAGDVYARIQAAREILERTGVKVEAESANIEIEVPVQLVIGMTEEMEAGNED